MKKGKLFSCLAATAAVILSATLLALAAQQPPDTIIIQPSIWQSPSQPPVTFNHKNHATQDNISCNQCHMNYKNGINVWKEGDPVEQCEQCHNDPTTGQVANLPAAQQKLNLELAYHNLCVTCHRNIKNQHPTANAPTVCAGCHIAQPPQ